MIGLIGIGAMGAVAASAAYPTANKPVSRKVDVGGFRLAIHCRGKGSPTVVLEGGAGASSAAWLGIKPKVAKTTRVCSYDRAGHGNSDARRPARPKPVPAGKVVTELHRLLRGADIRPPYVLGGSNIGAFFNRLYAKRYPTEVVGLVSVDGTPIGLPGEPFLNLPATLGYPPQEIIGLPPDDYYAPGAAAELRKRPNLRARPFVVLTHGILDQRPNNIEPQWSEWQKQLARLSGSSMLVRSDIADQGAIHWRAPDLTAEAFRLVVVAARRGARLPPCAATRLPNLYATCLDPTRP